MKRVFCVAKYILGRKMWNLDATNGEMHVKRGTIGKSKENCLGHNLTPPSSLSPQKDALQCIIDSVL